MDRLRAQLADPLQVGADAAGARAACGLSSLDERHAAGRSPVARALIGRGGSVRDRAVLARTA